MINRLTEINRRGIIRSLPALFAFFIICGEARLMADDAGKADLVPLQPKLPAPAFVGTPKDLPADSTVEPAPEKPPAPLMIPRDAKNIAPEAKLTCSDPN